MLEAMALARPDWEFIVLSPYELAPSVLLPNVIFDRQLSRGRTTKALGWRHWWFDMVLPKVVDTLHANIFWAPDGLVPFRLKGVPIALTIHDFVPERHPETMPWIPRHYRKWNMRHWLTRAEVILPVSKATADEAFSMFGVRAHAVVYPGVDDIFINYQPKTGTGPSEALPSYFVALGTMEPRKNLTALLNCIDTLERMGVWPTGAVLRIVGGKGWKDSVIQETVTRLKTRGIIQVLGYVPRETLPALLAGARALLMPSIYEGFGMPIAEAMAVGCPIICSDIPPFKEVTGRYPALIHGTDQASMVAAYRSFLTSPWTRFLPNPQEMDRSRFTWGRSAIRLLEAIQIHLENPSLSR